MGFLYAEILLSADLELFIISNINIQIVVQVAVKTQLKLKKYIQIGKIWDITLSGNWGMSQFLF